MIVAEKTQVLENISLDASFSKTYNTWTGLEANLDFLCDRSVTNCLSHGTSSKLSH